MALVDLLLSAANSSDAMQHGLTPAKVQVFPNGEFCVDDAYLETVVQPYRSEHFTQQSTAAATSSGDSTTVTPERSGLRQVPQRSTPPLWRHSEPNTASRLKTSFSRSSPSKVLMQLRLQAPLGERVTPFLPGRPSPRADLL